MTAPMNRAFDTVDTPSEGEYIFKGIDGDVLDPDAYLSKPPIGTTAHSGLHQAARQK